MAVNGSKRLFSAGKKDRLHLFLSRAASAAEMGDAPGAGSACSSIGFLGRKSMEQGG